MSNEQNSNLGATPLAPSQINYTLQNEFNDGITLISQHTVDLDLSAGDHVFSAADWQIAGDSMARLFNCSAQTEAISITLPEDLNRVVSFYNSGDYNIVLLSADSAVPVIPNQLVTVAYDGSAMRILSGHISIVEAIIDEEIDSNGDLETGDVFIVGTGAGELAGQDNNFAVHRGDMSYSFITPFDGQIVRNRDREEGSSAVPRLMYFDADDPIWNNV